jgi:hypothetical protein
MSAVVYAGPVSAMVLIVALCGWSVAAPGSAAIAVEPLSPVAFAQDDAETVVTLRIGESVTPSGSTTVVTFTAVSDDSRCPDGANCIWAGDATVTFRVQPAKGEAQVVALRFRGQDARSATVAGLRLTLERLDPAPKVGETISGDQYQVAVAIARAG